MFGSSFPADNRHKATNFAVAAGMFIQQLTEPKNVEFREMYSLPHARKVRAAVRMPLAYLGGAKSLAGAQQAMDEGFDAIVLGRALIFDSHFVNKLRNGSVTSSECTACNRCVAMMYSPGGTSCVLHAPGDASLNGQAAAG
jgi:2,4-dienoyl-CoA reductase (NADPH2)